MASFRSILVPVVDDPASLDAVTIAASLARQVKGRVSIVHVIEVARNLPVTADMDREGRRGEDLLRRALALAKAGNGITIDDQLLQAREAGPAIVEEAASREVEVIILGLGYKPLLGQFRVGHTADYVLKHAHCNVWIVRQPLAEAAEVAPQATARR